MKSLSNLFQVSSTKVFYTKHQIKYKHFQFDSPALLFHLTKNFQLATAKVEIKRGGRLSLNLLRLKQEMNNFDR